MNPYEQLLPHWRSFCEARRSVAHERQSQIAAWLLTVGARDAMHRAMVQWMEVATLICGDGTTIEWPEGRDITFFTGEEFVDGPCIVAGCMFFSDELPRLDWTP